MIEGKLSYKQLEEIIKKFSFSDKTMIKGPGIGIDCTVFENGDNFILVTSDPVTYMPSGKYCVNVNVNDVAAMGGDPWFFLCTIILPVDCTENTFENIMDEIKEECEKFKINFGGGHTEINKVVNSPVICGFMVGKCKKDELRGSFNAQDGDALIITKGVSVEGTSIIVESKAKEIIEQYGSEFYKKCSLYKDRLSVLDEAKIARPFSHAMHDITEGGLINGLYEIAVASNVSIEIDFYPIIPECKILCDTLHINPLGLISAGTLAITTKNKNLKDILINNGIEAFEVGRVIKDGKNEVRYKGCVQDIFKNDEIVKLFNGGSELGA
jgi:hydrogenase maturation factor